MFDHVNEIRKNKSPDYYTNLSEENKKSFQHFMLLRALSMDDDALEQMAFLYRYFHLIPGAQFYTLLCALTPRTNRWIPWIKTKVVKHSQKLLSLVASHYQISRRQANEYVNVFIATEEGLENLVTLCESKGLNEAEVSALFDKE